MFSCSCSSGGDIKDKLVSFNGALHIFIRFFETNATTCHIISFHGVECRKLELKINVNRWLNPT